MFSLTNIYTPITATPFANDKTYCEIPPCEALKPYVRCFWGTKYPFVAEQEQASLGLVIPDTCMDIFFNIDYTQNSYQDFFCTVDEHSYSSGGGGNTNLTATFAIRFYAWTAILFAEQDFRESKNKNFSVEVFFGKLKAELEPLLFDVPTLQGKIEAAERFLIKRLRTDRINNNLMNAVYHMIDTCGRAKISDVCGYVAISEKQLERIFNYNMGISPKAFSSLIRYQLLWQDMVFSKNFNVLNAVEKYGYTDQAHLLNDFKRRHLMNPREALEFAHQRH